MALCGFFIVLFLVVNCHRSSPFVSLLFVNAGRREEANPRLRRRESEALLPRRWLARHWPPPARRERVRERRRRRRWRRLCLSSLSGSCARRRKKRERNLHSRRGAESEGSINWTIGRRERCEILGKENNALSRQRVRWLSNTEEREEHFFWQALYGERFFFFAGGEEEREYSRRDLLIK